MCSLKKIKHFNLKNCEQLKQKRCVVLCWEWEQSPFGVNIFCLTTTTSKKVSFRCCVSRVTREHNTAQIVRFQQNTLLEHSFAWTVNGWENSGGIYERSKIKTESTQNKLHKNVWKIHDMRFFLLVLFVF